MKINTDRIIGLSAMLISLVTLVIFIYQTNLMRVQSRLSVTPRLVFQTSQSQQDSILYYSMEIVNKGLGPAIVESINILHEDEAHELDFEAFLEKVYPDIGQYGELVQSMTMGKGSTLLPSESNVLFSFGIDLPRAEALMQYLGVTEDESPFHLEVVYSSIYREKWRIRDSDQGHPVKL